MRKILIAILVVIVAAVAGYYAFPEKVAGCPPQIDERSPRLIFI